MENYIERAQKIESRIMELALCTDDERSVNRIFGTKPFIDCSDKIVAWMRQTGLQTYVDNIGNVRGKLLSKNADAKTFVIGSHFDTALTSGKFDGSLGILCGLDIVENIISQKINLPFNIEIIAFSEEEGIRFHETYLGSKVVAGLFDEHLVGIKDDKGHSLKQILHAMKLDISKVQNDLIPQKEWLGYLEIHIEEGPVLYERNIPVGVVSAISGQRRVEIKFEGQYGHAGIVPMNRRADALCAAANFIVAVEDYASHEKRNIVATIGKITVPNAAFNVIPETTYCTLDLRSANAESLSDAYEDLYKICEDICMKRKIYFEWKLVHESDPVICDEALKLLLGKSVRQKNLELTTMVSGAGHDVVIISQVAPVAMLFVKCQKGFKRSILENVETEDIAIVSEIGDNFIKQLSYQCENVKIR